MIYQWVDKLTFLFIHQTCSSKKPIIIKLHRNNVFCLQINQNVLVSTTKWPTYFKVTTTVLRPLCRYFYYLSILLLHIAINVMLFGKLALLLKQTCCPVDVCLDVLIILV